MPYIRKSRRPFVRPETESNINEPGELNFAITELCLEYLDGEAPSYRDFIDVIGVLESCKLEFYRRAVVPYEEAKILENGDVY